MSYGARCGSLVLLVGLITGAALAQDQKPTSWTEPPVRGSAGPDSSDKPGGEPAKPSAEAPAPARSERSAEAPKKEEPSTGPARSTRRSAKLRRAQIRREAARANVVADPPRSRRHTQTAAETVRPRSARRLSAPRVYAYRAYPARPAYGWRSRVVAYEAEPPEGPLTQMRSEGWGNLLGAGRVRRIAEARAAGYIVMRSRTVTYPDGTRLRSLTPYETDDGLPD